jgi:hypothetical protein
VCTDVIRCNGEFRVEVLGAGNSINLDYVYLSPGAWGRYKNLPILLSGANLLLKMGISSIRAGGSFAGNSPWYDWTDWTGPVWTRPSIGDRWGNDLIAGFGPFVRCAVFDRNLHSRMPLSFTPLLRLKHGHTCDQWHSSWVFTNSYRLTLYILSNHCRTLWSLRMWPGSNRYLSPPPPPRPTPLPTW